MSAKGAQLRTSATHSKPDAGKARIRYAEMRPRFFALIGGLLSLFGRGDPKKPIRTRAGTLTFKQVEAIVLQCGGPAGMVKISHDELVIEPVSDIMVTGCVLKALHATGETSLPSVGNEMHQVP